MQKNTILPGLVCALVAGPSPAGTGTERADAHEVVAMVRKAVALIEKEGTAAIATIADPSAGYAWKDTYIFVVNCEADQVLANPAFPARVGGDIKQHKDYAGRRYGLDLCHTASRPGGGWIEYVWLTPGDRKPRRKISFVMSVTGAPYQVGAGVYDHTTDFDTRSSRETDSIN